MSEAYTAFAAGYDRMMGDVDYDGWAKYLDGFLREAGARTLLECACGTGSLTVRLGRMGYAVTGADLSEDMLMVARTKALTASTGCGCCPSSARTCAASACTSPWTRSCAPATG